MLALLPITSRNCQSPMLGIERTNIENHCVSLEIAKQLKEAGWKKETEFWWVDLTFSRGEWLLRNSFEASRFKEQTKYPAPLATEILEELPCIIKIKQFLGSMDGHLETYKKEYKGKIWYGVCYRSIKHCTDFTLPNALAKMWIYLKKEGLL